VPVASDDERWRGDIVWFATVVCAFVGPLAGCLVFGVFKGKPWLFLGVDIAGVPVAAYALLSFTPIGLVAGALGGRLCLKLIDRGYAARGVPAVLMLGFVSGAVLAPVLAATPVLMTGGRPEAAMIIASIVSGGACGVLIANYARVRATESRHDRRPGT
jgi:hypothetical protein